jgi:mycothiol synthase
MAELPLSQRIVAPDVLTIPVVDGVAWRAATIDDLDAIANLTRASDLLDHPNYLVPREEIEDTLTASWVDLPADSLIGESADGTAVACGLVILGPSRETLVRSMLEGSVHPDWRGRTIGCQLLDWQQGRALQQLATAEESLPGELAIYAAEKTVDLVRMSQTAGFTIARYYNELQRDLTEPLPTPREIEGVTFGVFDLATQSEAVRLAKNDSFRDHWGSQPTTEEAWGQHVNAEIARPDLSVIAVAANGDIAGFVVCDSNPEDWPGQGFSSAYIELVGTPRAYRGRGIAAACLIRALELIAAAGLDKAVLDVDSENPTGALGLYDGLGFTPATRTLMLNKIY